MEKTIVDNLHELYKITDEGRIFAFSIPPKRIIPQPETPLPASETPLELPKQPQPGECCGQSCPNCVWMNYVGEMKGLVEKGLIDKKHLLDMINDLDVVPGVKAFLKLEVNSWS